MNTKKILIVAALFLAPLGLASLASEALPTAQSQARGSTSDNLTTRQARQRLVNDTSLSVASRNVTIVTLDRKMTLQGMVPTQSEKNRVFELAKSVSPDVEVVDQMTVAKEDL